jgi:drug/metabolite transporter (DMT)-like permease
MVPIAFALSSALFYGVSDFVGGILSKSRSVWMVAICSQLTAGLATALVALFVPARPTGADFGWAVAGGFAAAIGISFLYAGLSGGRMNVVAPISGIGAALVPVVVGVATGDKPSILGWIGIAIAFPAIYLVAHTAAEHQHAHQRSAASSVVYGVTAGLGFGAVYALVAQIGNHAGFMPLAVVQLVAAIAIGAVAIALHQPWLPRGRHLGRVFAFGLLGTTGLVCFLIATWHGVLSIIAVIAALYPASTVMMARIVLHERFGRWQLVGLVLTASAIILVTID